MLALELRAAKELQCKSTIGMIALLSAPAFLASRILSPHATTAAAAVSFDIARARKAGEHGREPQADGVERGWQGPNWDDRSEQRHAAAPAAARRRRRRRTTARVSYTCIPCT